MCRINIHGSAFHQSRVLLFLVNRSHSYNTGLLVLHVRLRHHFQKWRLVTSHYAIVVQYPPLPISTAAHTHYQSFQTHISYNLFPKNIWGARRLLPNVFYFVSGYIFPSLAIHSTNLHGALTIQRPFSGPPHARGRTHTHKLHQYKPSLFQPITFLVVIKPTTYKLWSLSFNMAEF